MGVPLRVGMMNKPNYAIVASEQDLVDLAELNAKQDVFQEQLIVLRNKYLNPRIAIEDWLEADSKAWHDLCTAMWDLNDEYDLAHPLPPCPECGRPISASMHHRYPSWYLCHAIASCKLAPPFFGG
jgi:hypothetical protein